MTDDDRPLTFNDLTRALAPLQLTLVETSGDVKRLALDHVTRADMNALRTEMRSGFAAADERYVLREISDLRYADITKRLDGHDAEFKAWHLEQQAAERVDHEHNFTLGNNLVTWFLAGVVMVATLGALIVSIITLTRMP